MIAVPAIARYAKPVFIAEKPSTSCMYSVSVRKIDSVTMVRMNPAMFAPLTVLIRRMPKRISGAG